MNLLLINPYCTTNNPKRTYPLEPLGLISIATYLNENINQTNEQGKIQNEEIKVAIYDAHLEGPKKSIETKRGYKSGATDKQILDHLRDYKAEIIGITNNYTSQLQDVLDLCKLIKISFPKTKIIIGGAHATIDHKELIKEPNIDYIVIGEGEITFTELINAIIQKKNITEIQGITYKSENNIKLNDKRQLIQNLDSLPIMDRSLINFKEYLYHSPTNYYSTLNIPIGTIITSRGCPFRCVFCSTQKVWENKWRSRSVNNIFEEIVELVKEYGVKEISFQDDQFQMIERIKHL